MFKEIIQDALFDKFQLGGFTVGILIIFYAIGNITEYQYRVTDYYKKSDKISVNEIVPQVDSVCIESYVDECLTFNIPTDVNVIATRDKFSKEEKFTIYIRSKTENVIR